MNPRLINGVEYISTQEAAQWLGVDRSTLLGNHYKMYFHPIKLDGMQWWPLTKVLAFDKRKFDGRYKEAKG